MTAEVATLRVNVGCGDFPLPGWCNVDSAPSAAVDLVASVPPLPWDDESVAELYAGHYLEHLDQPTAREFLRECQRVLVPGGRLGILVPDTHEIMRRYLVGERSPVEWPQGTHRDMRDLDQICEMFLYSTAQPSHHLWSYDLVTLRRALELAGLVVDQEIDRHRDPRVAVGAWYQMGWDAHKP